MNWCSEPELIWKEVVPAYFESNRIEYSEREIPIKNEHSKKGKYTALFQKVIFLEAPRKKTKTSILITRIISVKQFRVIPSIVS
jgi:hypothetical protein